MPALNHVHSYQRLDGKRWRCTDPYCTHTTPTELVAGKASKCGCGAEFILDREAMRRRTPKCLNCSDTAKARLHKRAQMLIHSILAPREEDQSGNNTKSETD